MIKRLPTALARILFPEPTWFRRPSLHAAVMHTILVMTLLGAMFFFIFVAATSDLNLLITLGNTVPAGVLAALIVWNRRGHTESTAWIFVSILLLSVLLQMQRNDYNRVQVGTLLMLITLIGALTLGLWRGTIIATVSAIVTLVMTVYLFEVEGVEFLGRSSPYVAWFSHTLFIFVVLGTLATVLAALQRSQQRESMTQMALDATADLLSTSRSRFDTLVERLPVAVFMASPEGDLTYGNAALWETVGQPRDVMLGNALLEHVHPEDRARTNAQYHAMIDDKSPQSFEIRVLPADGRVRWIEMIMIPQFMQDGDVSLVLGIVYDQTLKKEHDRMMAERVAMLDGLNAGVISTNRALEITAWNDGATRLFGYTAEEAMGQKMSQLLQFNVGKDWAMTADKSNPERWLWQGDVQVTDKQGNTLDDFMVLTVDPSTNDQHTTLSVHIDVTTRTQLALQSNALQQERQRREITQTVIHEFTHDLREPLSTLLMLVQTLSLAPTQAADLIAGIERQSFEISDVVHSMLVLLHAEQDKYKMRVRRVNLSDMVKQQLRIFDKQIKARQITFDAKLPTDDVSIMAGPQELRRAMRHLLAHCISHIPDNGELRCYLEKTATHARLRLWCKTALVSILTAGAAENGAPSSTIAGGGFGIQLAQQLIVLHAGTLTEQRTPDGGVEVQCELPIDMRKVDLMDMT